MAVDADDGFADVTNMPAEIADQIGILPGHGIADGVGNIDRRGSGLDCRLHDFSQKFRLGPGGIFRGELNIRSHRFGQTHPFGSQTENLLVGFLELVFPVDLGCGEKDMDAGTVPCRKQCLSGLLNVPGNAASQSGNHRTSDLAGDGLHGFKIPVTDDGKSRLDNIHVQACKLTGDLELFTEIHGGSGALLAVTQGGVEDQNPVGIDAVVCYHGKLGS